MGGTLEGQVLVNGRPRSRGFRAISAYVLQDDVLFSNLTVRSGGGWALLRGGPPGSGPTQSDASERCM